MLWKLDFEDGSRFINTAVHTVAVVWNTIHNIGAGMSSVGRASDWHAADAGSIPRCHKGFFFFFSQKLSVQTILRCAFTPPVCNRIYQRLCARWRSCNPYQSSLNYADTKTSSMHRRLGSATLLRLAFPRESDPNLPWEKSQWHNTVVDFFGFF